MTNPLANISGLSSGIKWADIVDQLVQVEQARSVTPISDQITSRSDQKTAWTTFQGLVNKMNDSARTLRSGGIGGFTATAPVSPLTSKGLLSVSASTTASPGTYKVEVLQLAQAAKVSGGAVASSSTALGWSGDFAVNGSNITVAGTDTLSDIRTKINDANSGSTPTGVTATILSNGSGGGRLVLTRDTPGATGISLTEGTGGIARELGFVDSRTKPVSSTMTAIASALGLSVSPPPATIKVAGRTVTVDLSTDSISSIVSKINAAGGQASIGTDQNGGAAAYRVIADGNVTADPSDTNSQAVIDALGFGTGQFGAVSQAVSTGVLTTGAGAAVTSASSLSDLKMDGAATGIAVGDAINIKGTRGDGTVVSTGITVGPADTIQSLLDKINDASTGFGSGVRTANAILGADGKIRLTDGTGGDSRLNMSLSVAKADGTNGTLGTPAIDTVGRQREVSAPQDAQLRVDGVFLTRSSNTVADAVPGLTMNLQNAEPGTTVNVSVQRDNDSAVKAVQGFADAYNNIIKFVEEQRVTGAPLYGNTSLRSTVATVTDALRTQVASNSIYSTLAVAGVSLNRFGTLDVDATKVKNALSTQPGQVEALFGLNGVGQAIVTTTDNATRFGSGTISSQLTSIDDGVRKLQLRLTAANTRLDARRLQLTEQFTRMETALSRLNGQGNYLTSAIKSLQG